MRVGRFTINDVLWSSLRECQQGSVQTALNYVSTPLEEEVKSCLISLPTGAGKSGVIAVVSQKATQQSVLILCHRRAVCDQLYTEVSGGFFRDRAEGEDISLKPVYDKVDDTSRHGIYVTTFQKLQTFDSSQLEQLKRNIDLVIVDEGHAEPSPVWRNLVRNIQAHKIVITATPYRNDLFQFDIDAQSSYIYTFENALINGILKEPDFQVIEGNKLVSNIRRFLDDNADAKCIVKCNKFSDVENYYSILNANFNLLAIHEQYAGDERENVKSSVPKRLKDSDYEVIVHQRKLDEGVDIPQAKLLVLTYVVNSGRELVQTIGRVVRLYKDVSAVVLEFDRDDNAQMWANYRRFDRTLGNQDSLKKFIGSLDTSALINGYMNSFPDSSYYGNRFLEKFNLNDFDPLVSLNIPTASVCFLNKLESFRPELMAEKLYWRCASAGELPKRFSTSLGIEVIVSIAFRKSEYLIDQFFFEPSLEITLFKEVSAGMVAIYDSRGRQYSGDKILRLGGAIPQDQLVSMMASGHSALTKEASSRSVSSARKRPESFAVKARDLDNIADMQGNAAYRLSTMKFDLYDQRNEKSGSYYIGVDSGRISDQKNCSFTLPELDVWLDSVTLIVSRETRVDSQLVQSFSKPIAGDESLVVKSLIFDFSEYSAPLIIQINGSGYEIDNDFLFCAVDTDGEFKLISGEECSKLSVMIENEEPYLAIDAEGGNYSFDQYRYTVDQKFSDFLFSKLHKALLSDGVGFSQGKFYQLSLPVEGGLDFSNSQLANVVIGLESLLGSGLDEKGYQNREYQVVNQGFSPNSIFYLLDKLRANHMPNPSREDLGPFNQYLPEADLILNTDMGTEPADFILSSPSKLVYVHVKCGASSTRPMSSAGGIAEVGSQAIKNIEMLISRNQNLRAGNWTELCSPWPRPDHPQLMHERIRLFRGELFSADNQAEREQALDEVWQEIAQRRQSLAVKKEVWIVSANSFSVGNFSNQLAQGHNARSESLQAYQLIQSWLSTARNNDVDLKIFVSP
ncbi:DEAD/DEAH box helicase [Bacterioplanoides pacificum]|uniref:DEAD/DEAH box helicase n=1 Tax=Bacterioplanoides pacificum TaxID=1171596 RepID=A0ABV7VRL0_9GAMM